MNISNSINPMKRILYLSIISCVCFSIFISCSKNDDDKTSLYEETLEIVLRTQFQTCFEERNIYFIGNRVNGDFSNSFMKRFSDLNGRVRKMSQQQKKGFEIVDKDTQDKGIIIDIEVLEKPNKNEIKIGSSCYDGFSLSGYLYTLSSEEDRWTIVSKEQTMTN